MGRKDEEPQISLTEINYSAVEEWKPRSGHNADPTGKLRRSQVCGGQRSSPTEGLSPGQEEGVLRWGSIITRVTSATNISLSASESK